MRKVLFFLLSFSLINNTDAQQMVKFYINNINKGEIKMDPSKVMNAEVSLKKYAKTKSLFIEIGNTKEPGPFKQTLQLTNKDDSVLLSVPENSLHSGRFNIDIRKLKSLVRSFKDQKIYELQDPKNPMMRMPSRRSLLLNIHYY